MGKQIMSPDEIQCEGTRFRILLVDDDSTERTGVRFLIEKLKLPLDIKEASNGKRALEVLKYAAIDILFTDVKMPYIDGLELSSIVKSQYPHIKIIIFSAYGEFDYAKRAMEANVVNYLLKPVDVAEFEKVLGDVISQCREDKYNAHQSNKRSLAVKKLHWINLLTGKSQLRDEPALEKSIKGTLRDSHVVLAHIETQREELGQNEPQILQLLDACISYPFEYINIYPNSSYLIIFANASYEELLRFAQDIISKSDCLGETPSILISRVEHGLEKLNELYMQLNNLRKQMCVWEAPILFAQEFETPSQTYFSQVAAKLEATKRAIESHNRKEIMTQIGTLLDTMSAHGMIDVTYMHHIMCEVLASLYAERGLVNSSSLQTQIYRFSTCRTRVSIMNIFEDILRTDESAQENSIEGASHAVYKVIQIIKSEYSQDLSLDYLAACVGFTPSYLSFIFKHETGENLIKYITDYRMNQAKKLLDSDSTKIVQVAKQCGYSSASYFNRLFKNTYGITPKQYREKV